MKMTTTLAALCLMLGGLLTSSGIFAAELPDLGESATNTISQRTATESLKKDAVCTKCHDENEVKPVLSIYQTKHGVKGDARTPSCQSCHGDSDAHVKNADGKATRPSPDVIFGMKSGSNSSFPRTASSTQNASCQTCHANAGGKRNHWTGSQHESRNIVCAACHEVHAKQDKVLAKVTQPEVCFNCHKTQRSETHKFSVHPVDAAKMTCSDCHNPHGSTGPKLLLKNSVNETCHTCHAEKRGPFLFEHQPVTEDCTNCHTPHGSSTVPLLKERTPFLCQQCHQDHGSSLKSDQSVNSATTTATAQKDAATFGKLLTVQGNGRKCLNCHVMIHGTNHPGGAALNR